VARIGGVYITHLRNVHTERGFGGGGVTEALEIGRRSGVKVHFSHYRTATENAGQVERLMEEIDRAKAEGVDCTLELYPYPTGSGYPMMFLPPEANNGGTEAILELLRVPAKRRSIAAYIDEHHTGNVENDEGVFTHVPSENNRHLEGMTFSDAARERGVSAGELICSLLLEEELTGGFLQAPPAAPGGLGTDISGCGRSPVTARLHGRQRFDLGALASSPSRLRHLPEAPWPAATKAPGSFHRGHGPAYER
jgi:N-acyl-D-amino-acid deacylase